LQRCLTALGSGTRTPDEVIVVDQQASPEAHACLAVLGSIPHRYVAQERLGLSASRNLVLRLAEHRYLAVTDDDCIPDPDWVETIMTTVAVADPPLVVTGAVLPTREAQPGEFMVSQRANPNRQDHTRRRPPWRIGTGGNFVADVAVLRSVGGWDDRLGAGSAGRAAEDIELIDRLLRNGAAIRYEPGVVVRHELQDLTRRLATRWSYAFGIGAFLAMRVRARDRFALNILFDYLRMHAVSLFNASCRFDRLDVRQHARALVGLVPGAWYGIRLQTTTLGHGDGSRDGTD
jgi:GT2 family glycosyltransferase